VKDVGRLFICLAGGLVLNAGLRAGDAVLPDNPYAPIVTRNVFNLNPPPPPGAAQPAEPPPKIVLNGIMSILGRWQVLFKVSPQPKPGQQTKERAYILSEGEQQDDIEVTKINEADQIVTFNNHGVVQELPLTVATASGASGPAPGGPGVVPPFPVPKFPPGVSGGPSIPGTAGSPGSVIHFGQSSGIGGQNRGVSMSGFNPNNNNLNSGASSGGTSVGGANFGSRLGVALGGGGSPAGTQSGLQSQVTLSGDEQQALLAYQHAQALKGESSLPPQIFPPTKYDQEMGIPSSVPTPPVPGDPASQ
jgi:hypothetical protein